MSARDIGSNTFHHENCLCVRCYPNLAQDILLTEAHAIAAGRTRTTVRRDHVVALMAVIDTQAAEIVTLKTALQQVGQDIDAVRGMLETLR